MNVEHVDVGETFVWEDTPYVRVERTEPNKEGCYIIGLTKDNKVGLFTPGSKVEQQPKVVNVRDIPVNHVFKNVITGLRIIRTDWGILYSDGSARTLDDSTYLTKCIDLGPLSDVLKQCE